MKYSTTLLIHFTESRRVWKLRATRTVLRTFSFLRMAFKTIKDWSDSKCNSLMYEYKDSFYRTRVKRLLLNSLIWTDSLSWFDFREFFFNATKRLLSKATVIRDSHSMKTEIKRCTTSRQVDLDIWTKQNKFHFKKFSSSFNKKRGCLRRFGVNSLGIYQIHIFARAQLTK